MTVTISHPTGILSGSPRLPASKSESNRLLILQALSGGRIACMGLSEAEDTKVLSAALSWPDREVYVGDAGTAMRFLTAYYCAVGRHTVLTGSERMCERPIGLLVQALRHIGFTIRYLAREGYPPIEILAGHTTALRSEVHIDGHISSQYVSAMLMIAPMLPAGLTVHFDTAVTSRPYIELTLHLLAAGGISHEWDGDSISIPAGQSFDRVLLRPALDWSAASYWYSMAALSQSADIRLLGLSFDTAQGDRQMAVWMQAFGIESRASEECIMLTKSATLFSAKLSTLHFDFSACPDLAQTVIVICAARGVDASFSGLQSLRIKETDRIAALQNELFKLGVRLYEDAVGTFRLDGRLRIAGQAIDTYNDHRMAMAFAPLALLGQISIRQPEVTQKSYPSFWDEIKEIGFEVVQVD